VTKGLDQPDTPEGPEPASAPLRARAISEAEGVDAFQALQRVLYRSAKQDPQRRFHALYDKLTRRDVMWRAWVNVATTEAPPASTAFLLRRSKTVASRRYGPFSISSSQR
jgi:hypothetical protein